MLFSAVNIGDSFQRALDAFIGFLPNILAFLVIVAIGFIVAKVVQGVLNKVLEGLKVDRTLHSSDAGRFVERVSPNARPSRLIGLVAFWFIFLFALSAGIAALKIPALTAFITDIQQFLPNVIAAVLIFVVAAAIAGAAGALVQRLMGDTPTGKIVRAVVPGVVLAIGMFMVLDQLQIAPQIVTITYAAIMGLLVLAGGLAFGLGGREVAADMMRDAYEKGRRNRDTGRRDMEVGRQRAASHAKVDVKPDPRMPATEPTRTRSL